MSELIDLRVQWWCAYSGAFIFVALGVGFLIAGFIPPPAPYESAEQIARTIRDHSMQIRAGMWLAMFGSAFLVPLIVVIFRQMRRIGPAAKTLAYVQLTTGVTGMFIFFVPMMLISVAAYRADQRAPETTQLLNDICWLMFVGTWALGIVQFLVTGVGTWSASRRPSRSSRAGAGI